MAPSPAGLMAWQTLGPQRLSLSPHQQPALAWLPTFCIRQHSFSAFSLHRVEFFYGNKRRFDGDGLSSGISNSKHHTGRNFFLTLILNPGSFFVANRISDAIDHKVESLSATFSQVPLPAALPLFATGLAGLGLLGWRRKKTAAG